MPTRIAVAAAMVVTAAAAMIGVAPIANAEPSLAQNFAINSEIPTLAELDAQIRLLVGTPAPDWVKAAQLEGGNRRDRPEDGLPHRLLPSAARIDPGHRPRDA